MSWTLNRRSFSHTDRILLPHISFFASGPNLEKSSLPFFTENFSSSWKVTSTETDILSNFLKRVSQAGSLRAAQLLCRVSQVSVRFWELSWGCFLAKPLKIGTLNMELFFSVRIRRKKWDMSEQNPWDLIFSSNLTWENAALLDGCDKIILSPRNVRCASDISRCVVEHNLSFWEHVTKAGSLYTAGWHRAEIGLTFDRIQSS